MDSQIAHAMIGGGKKEKRKKNDFYATPDEVTVALMDFIKTLNISFKYVWEPACGDGAMAKIIKSYGYEVVSTDLRQDSGYGTGEIDFSSDFDMYADAIITNPPFNLSHLFIEKAVCSANFVAMVLKSQYWHAAKRFDLFSKYPPAYILPLTWRPDFSFGEDGDSPLMDVIWTVWISGNTDAKYIPIKKPKIQLNLF